MVVFKEVWITCSPSPLKPLFYVYVFYIHCKVDVGYKDISSPSGLDINLELEIPNSHFLACSLI